MYENTRYGRLILISGVPYRVKGDTNFNYRCVCDCGRSLLVGGHRLRNGSVKSCGCLKIESQTKNLLENRCKVLIKITVRNRMN
ncbi:conserved hypothetical protein [Vibrio phage 489E54-1]|nr:conserved hypothetical protein [Vibrio phage 489E54-1]